MRTQSVSLAALVLAAVCAAAGCSDKPPTQPSAAGGAWAGGNIGAGGAAGGVGAGGVVGAGGATLSVGGSTGGGGITGTGGGAGLGGSVATLQGGSSAGGSSAGGRTSSTAGGGAFGGNAAGGVPNVGAGGASAGAGGGPWMFPAGVTKPKIMIVGDSISAGPGCYKKYLLKNLMDNGYSKFEFIGEYTDDCGGGVRHSAVSCSTAEQYTSAMFMMPNCQQGKSFPGMSTLMGKHKPDLVMLQLGVNDVWNGRSTEQTLADYQTLVTQARAQNAKVVLVVAQIQKIRPECSTEDTITKRAEALVKAVPAWASKLSTAESPVFVADLWTNSDFSMAETSDCVHPNDVGAQRMGLNWYNGLKGILTPN